MPIKGIRIPTLKNYNKVQKIHENWKSSNQETKRR